MTLAEREMSPATGITVETIERTREQLDLLERLVRTVLRRDEDYGVIPGTGSKQASLLKPGAANVTAAFNCHAEPHVDLATVEPGTGKYGFVNYEVHVDLVSNTTGAVMSRGYGASNSHEMKYRYRYAKPRCPQCQAEAVLESKNGSGYFCWRKLGGCGATFRPGDQAVETQTIGKVENENPLDMANTIKKMAVKRAEVDAAMRLPGVARFFTQDAEEIESAEDAPRATGKPGGEQAAEPHAETRSAADKGGHILTAGDLFNTCKQDFGITALQVLSLLSQLGGKEIKNAREIADLEKAHAALKTHFAGKGR